MCVCCWQALCDMELVGSTELWGEIGSDYSEFWHWIIFNPLREKESEMEGGRGLSEVWWGGLLYLITWWSPDCSFSGS